MQFDPLTTTFVTYCVCVDAVSLHTPVQPPSINFGFIISPKVSTLCSSNGRCSEKVKLVIVVKITLSRSPSFKSQHTDVI